MRSASLLLLALLPAACAAPACPPGFSAATTLEATFGRNRGEALVVRDADWEAFLAAEVTPRFPDGLTVIEAAGQWRDRAGRVLREPSKHLLLVLPGIAPAEAAARLAPVTAAYVQRFGQEAVLTLQRSACVAF
jgi:ABC-type amino acid transport substrate-binding protein